jgi:MFS family permease
VPLYVDRTHVGSAGTVFLIYGVLVLAIRIVASRLPDVLGTWRGPLLALALQAAGLAVLGAVASKAGLYGGTAIFGLGASLLYPSAFPLVVDRAPDEERSHAIGTFTLFFDLATGLGAPTLGLVVSLTNERGAFLGAAALNAAAFALHMALNPPSSAHQVLSEAAVEPG